MIICVCTVDKWPQSWRRMSASMERHVTYFYEQKQARTEYIFEHFECLGGINEWMEVNLFTKNDVCMYVCMYVYMCIYMYTCICIYIYIYIYTVYVCVCVYNMKSSDAKPSKSHLKISFKISIFIRLLCLCSVNSF